jgi:hypothetical protein
MDGVQYVVHLKFTSSDVSSEESIDLYPELGMIKNSD